MNKTKLLLLLIISLTISLKAQKDDRVSYFISNVVNRYKTFLSEERFIVYKSSPPYGEKEFRYMCFKYEALDISYDVQKTNSLVTPLTGVVLVNFNQTTNMGCGNINYGGGINAGWTKLDDAIIHINDKGCYKLDKPLNEVIAFNYSYQDDKWVIKEVIFQKFNSHKNDIEYNLNIPFTNKDFHPINDVRADSINSSWKKLIE